jgi:DNA-binding Xre family transcriptional regulator
MRQSGRGQSGSRVSDARQRALSAAAEAIDRDERDAIIAQGRAIKRHHDRLRAVFAQLQTERQRQGLSLAAIAEASGIDKARLSRLENARYPNVTIETLERYAQALGKEIRIELVDPAA